MEATWRRASRQERHPVYDFLFAYYSFRPGALLQWSPGPGVTLVGHAAQAEFGCRRGYVRGEAGVTLAEIPASRGPYLRWALAFLEATTDRPPQYSCFGLHEWAMVYRAPEVRHRSVPLRLSTERIAAVVDAGPLSCTHYDAFRFFSREAQPSNALPLTRETVTAHDQRGCIHVGMDLYRFGYKVYPWLEGELLADAFELAVAAREIDMRASPYDLRAYGFAPIRLETAEGRGEYVGFQRSLAERAHPIRARLLTVYRRLAEGCPNMGHR